MQLYLIHGRNNRRVRKKIENHRGREIRNADSFYQSCFHEFLHRFPCLTDRNVIRNENPLLVERLAISRWSRESPVYEVKVEIFKLEVAQSFFASLRDVLLRMKTIPEFARNKNFIALYFVASEHFFERP